MLSKGPNSNMIERSTAFTAVNATIINSNFRSAALASADFSSAEILGSLFQQAIMDGTNMTNVVIDQGSYGSMPAAAAYVVGEVNWSGAMLDGVSMRERYGRDNEDAG